MTHLPSGHKEGISVHVNSCSVPGLAERSFVITAPPGQDGPGKHRPLDLTVSEAETTAGDG